MVRGSTPDSLGGRVPRQADVPPRDALGRSPPPDQFNLLVPGN